MKTIHKLYSDTPDKVNGIMYNGSVIDGGGNRDFKTAVGFVNEKNKTSYIDVISDTFRTNELSVSFWIYPRGDSSKNSSIFSNVDNGKVSGIFYNCEDSDTDEGEIGLLWNDFPETNPKLTGIKISNKGWAHFVFVFEKEGIVKVFGNGKYILRLDLEEGLEKVNFSNIRLGGYSGWLDEFKLYKYKLKYGNVNIKEPAEENISYLFNTSRISGEFSVPTDIIANEINQPFYYLQETEYMKSHENYNIETQNNYKYYTDKSFYTITGGQNDGKQRLANGDFRTFPGKIYQEPLEEDK